jgi:hypothetical protein
MALRLNHSRPMSANRIAQGKARLRAALEALLTDPSDRDLAADLEALPSDLVRRSTGPDPDLLAGMVHALQHAHAVALAEVRAWRARWAELRAHSPVMPTLLDDLERRFPVARASGSTGAPDVVGGLDTAAPNAHGAR